MAVVELSGSDAAPLDEVCKTSGEGGDAGENVLDCPSATTSEESLDDGADVETLGGMPYWDVSDCIGLFADEEGSDATNEIDVDPLRERLVCERMDVERPDSDAANDEADVETLGDMPDWYGLDSIGLFPNEEGCDAADPLDIKTLEGGPVCERLATDIVGSNPEDHGTDAEMLGDTSDGDKLDSVGLFPNEGDSDDVDDETDVNPLGDGPACERLAVDSPDSDAAVDRLDIDSPGDVADCKRLAADEPEVDAADAGVDIGSLRDIPVRERLVTGRLDVDTADAGVDINSLRDRPVCERRLAAYSPDVVAAVDRLDIDPVGSISVRERLATDGPDVDAVDVRVDVDSLGDRSVCERRLVAPSPEVRTDDGLCWVCEPEEEVSTGDGLCVFCKPAVEMITDVGLCWVCWVCELVAERSADVELCWVCEPVAEVSTDVGPSMICEPLAEVSMGIGFSIACEILVEVSENVGLCMACKLVAEVSTVVGLCVVCELAVEVKTDVGFSRVCELLLEVSENVSLCIV